MVTEISKDLSQLLYDIAPAQYCTPCGNLSGASIGQHVRHSIEMFQCLLGGYKNGKINYDLRKRDIVIETSPAHAAEILENVLKQLQKPDKLLILQNDGKEYQSGFYREMLYCTEHLIHHMALIKIGVNETCACKLSENFGVAPSTIKYRQQCAQ